MDAAVDPHGGAASLAAAWKIFLGTDILYVYMLFLSHVETYRTSDSLSRVENERIQNINV